ncbi:MAG: glycosyltransferase [Bacteroidetes bacterium]|nr:glycosyltransferase [Bacteroidota bacterium]
MLPLVSIIIPVYNAEQFLAEAMLSALNQTYGNTEIIVIDDGSADKSFEIAYKYKQAGVKIIRQRNKGGSVARNRGLEESQGDYIKFLDADDILTPNAIKEQLAYMEDLEEDKVVFGDFNFMNSKGKITGTNTFLEQKMLTEDPVTFFLSNWKILISCPLHRTKTLKDIGGFDEKLPFGQESDLHLRLALSNIKFIYKPGLIFNYRSHNSDNRISVDRTKPNKNIEALVYSLEKKIKAIKARQGSLNPAQKRYFSLAYFGHARSFFISGQKTEGHYHLTRSKEYAKWSIPPYKGKTMYGFVYLFFGYIIGFLWLETLIARLNKNNPKKERDLNILFMQ